MYNNYTYKNMIVKYKKEFFISKENMENQKNLELIKNDKLENQKNDNQMITNISTLELIHKELEYRKKEYILKKYFYGLILVILLIPAIVITKIYINLDFSSINNKTTIIEAQKPAQVNLPPLNSTINISNQDTMFLYKDSDYTNFLKTKYHYFNASHNIIACSSYYKNEYDYIFNPNEKKILESSLSECRNANIINIKNKADFDKL